MATKRQGHAAVTPGVAGARVARAGASALRATLAAMRIGSYTGPRAGRRPDPAPPPAPRSYPRGGRRRARRSASPRLLARPSAAPSSRPVRRSTSRTVVTVVLPGKAWPRLRWVEGATTKSSPLRCASPPPRPVRATSRSNTRRPPFPRSGKRSSAPLAFAPATLPCSLAVVPRGPTRACPLTRCVASAQSPAAKTKPARSCASTRPPGSRPSRQGLCRPPCAKATFGRTPTDDEHEARREGAAVGADASPSAPPAAPRGLLGSPRWPPRRCPSGRGRRGGPALRAPARRSSGHSRAPPGRASRAWWPRAPGG